eukprot:TRINITY_DN7934_c0_g1_i3.p1 TRINITY_DN7934_c0_g1~~TRINITY_DN7934_c0_g1_i3.p1  ORF type:complete len:439 (-),score=64.84 TRINITY_DN7934_c0_g1_i3:244-1560(-)
MKLDGTALLGLPIGLLALYLCTTLVASHITPTETQPFDTPHPANTTNLTRALLSYDTLPPCKNGMCRDGLVCINDTCSYCSESSQCEMQDPATMCKFQPNAKLGVCGHRDLFAYTFTWREGVSFLIFFISAAISAGAGIGGGGIYIPILILITGFETKEAVPLSNTLVAGASLANLIQNFTKRRPHNPSKSLIDFETALLIEPLTLGGTIIGVFLHQIFPAYLILILLAVAMGITTVKTTTKGVHMHRKEQQNKDFPGLLVVNQTFRAAEELETDMHRDPHQAERKYPWGYITSLIVVFLVSSALSSLRGGDGDPSPIGIIQCSVSYWLTSVALFPLIFAIWLFVGRLVVGHTRDREVCRYVSPWGDQVLSLPSLLTYINHPFLLACCRTKAFLPSRATSHGRNARCSGSASSPSLRACLPRSLVSGAVSSRPLYCWS